MPKPYQVAAIPIRRLPDGGIEVLLVTSRETRRWVVPKGWPWRKVADHDAAAGEAWEEAGARGIVSPHIIGTYTYDKLRRGKAKTLRVDTYVLDVTELAESWPEKDERQRVWLDPAGAAERVAEIGLKAILRSLAP